eukprot:m.185716 g.185716  ORF g.185716 m.185716 type:complete len:415 (+) comp13605_c6_seq1:111-1355(+)
MDTTSDSSGVAYAVDTDLQELIDEEIDPTDLDAVKKKEKAITTLCEQHYKAGNVEGIRDLIHSIRPFLSVVSKAKGGKLFKQLIDRFVDMENATPEEKVEMCQNCIDWAKEKKRSFLRQALEVRLISLHLEAEEYQACLAAVEPLLKELKKLDDRQLLMEVHLMESNAYFSLANYPKSRASLVAARTTANSIYCPPRMQAALDLQSGVLHAEENDFKTAYSYFYEAFEGFDSVDIPKEAVRALKYMLLCKILLEEASDVPSIVTGKLALKYSGPDLEAMQAIAAAAMNRSLADFQQALDDFTESLQGDVIVKSHVDAVYESLLEQNLLKLVEPFSRVELDHVANLINLPEHQVERKLSHMILDRKLLGILDQGSNCLEIFSEEQQDSMYDQTLQMLTQTNVVVDALYKKAEKIM